jgi:hypothetical protein
MHKENRVGIEQEEQERGERATAALFPFVQEWGLPLNPEDLEEMAYAVLSHADSDRSLEEIHQAVKDQLAEYKQKQAAFQREAYGDSAGDKPAR